MSRSFAAMSQTEINSAISDHYSYECKMLFKAFETFVSTKNQFIHDAMKELFCLHVRAVAEFYVKQNCAKAILRMDSQFGADKFNDKYRKTLNNAVVHLCDRLGMKDFSRIDDEMIVDIVCEISALIRQFSGEVDEKYRKACTFAPPDIKHHGLSLKAKPKGLQTTTSSGGDVMIGSPIYLPGKFLPK